MKYFFSTELPINADHFWRIKDTAEYMNFIKEETPFKQLEILEKVILENTYTTKIKSEPILAFDMVLKKFFGIDNLAVVNTWECTINPPYIGNLVVIPPIKQDKIKVYGEIKILPKNENECIQMAEINFEINMFGSKFIENKLRYEFEKTYKRLPIMISKFLNKNPPTKSTFLSYKAIPLQRAESKREIPIETNYSDESASEMPHIIKKIEVTEHYEYLSATSGVITEISTTHTNTITTSNAIFYTPPPPALMSNSIFYSAKQRIRPRWMWWSICMPKKWGKPATRLRRAPPNHPSGANFRNEIGGAARSPKQP
jgi:hypothetical protein